MNPFKMLEEEHRVIERALEVLEAISERIALGEQPPVNDLRHVLHFIVTFADKCHHGKEEDKLFPAMELKGISRVEGPLGILKVEHDLGREYVEHMRRGVKDILNGNPRGYDVFRRNATEYVKLLRGHIEYEDEEVYPLGMRVLDEESLGKLCKEFEDVERSIGEGVHEDHIKMLDELYRRYCD